MKYIILFLFVVLVSCFTFLGYAMLVVHPLQVTQEKQPASFSFTMPPSQTLRGDIISMSGEVLLQSRIATQSAKIASPEAILQGEEIQTGNSGNITISFNKSATISALANSDITFVQTLPADIVISQTAGSVSYTKLGGVPLSIRNFDLLTNILKGNSKINISKDERYTTVFMQSGAAVIGYDDVHYKSHVISLVSKDTFVFDNTTKQGIVE